MLLVALFASCTGAPATQPGAQPSSTLASPAASSPGSATLVPSPQPPAPSAQPTTRLQEFPVPPGSHPHDVAPARDGGVWYTAQASGKLGLLDPKTGRVEEIPLGGGSAPHGVIVGPDGAAWVTDSGLNAIVRVDASTHAVKRFPLPDNASGANLNTATFDADGVLWFTGQSGWYGRVVVGTGKVDVFEAPKGRGPYGIATGPGSGVAYSSLAGSHIAFVEVSSGRTRVIDTPTAGGGARRIWFDSQDNAWVTEWFAGKIARYSARDRRWQEWPLPGSNPQPYAVYVDDRDDVWITDFGANAIVRFDPDTERFERFELPSANAAVRQLLGRPGEVWGAESGADKLVVIRTAG
jgi:virginiamycin B lyase